jgi:D-aminopeptidase
MIEAAACESLERRREVEPYVPGSPCVIEVEFKDTRSFEDFCTRPGVDAVGERRIRVAADDWWTAWSSFMQLSVYRPA